MESWTATDRNFRYLKAKRRKRWPRQTDCQLSIKPLTDWLSVSVWLTGIKWKHLSALQP